MGSDSETAGTGGFLGDSGLVEVAFVLDLHFLFLRLFPSRGSCTTGLVRAAWPEKADRKTCLG